MGWNGGRPPVLAAPGVFCVYPAGMEGEWAYYAARSGLAPAQNFTLDDHKNAVWGGAGEHAFLVTALGHDGALDDLAYEYWKGLATGMPAGLSVDDYKHAVVAAG